MKRSWKAISLIAFIVLGALAFSVFIVACGGGNSTSIIARNPTPSITNLSPSTAATGSTSQSIAINGTGFISTSLVTFNGVAHVPTFVNASQLTISLTVADLTTAGSYPVVVTNPAPGGGASAALNFSVITNNPAPTITMLSPASVAGGAASQTLTINGTGFVTSSTVTFNGIVHSSTYVNATKLTISLTSADLATIGSYPVVVANPAPGGGSSASVTFNVWNTFTDSSTKITFAFPLLGTTTPTVTSFPPIGGIASFDIDGWSASQQSAVPVIEVSEYPNTSGMTLQQWFETDVDVNGLLLAAGTFQSQQYPNGVSALTLAGPIPSQYLSVGAPTEEVYAMSPDGKYVITMTEAQNAQISDYGYSSIPLLEQILSTMAF
jgi:hypothetical protein